MNHQTASQAKTESTPGGGRRGWGMLACGLVGGGVLGICAGVLMGSLKDILGSHGPTHLLTTGRVVGPADLDLAEVRVLALRNGRQVGSAGLDGAGRFRMSLEHGGRFDLFVTDWRARRDPSSPHPAPASKVAMEGSVLGLVWGARGVVIRVLAVPLTDVSIRVRGPDGSPARGEVVWLQSVIGEVKQRTNSTGTARFAGIPTRTWRASSRLTAERASSLVTGWLEFVPQGQVVDVTIPVGVRIFVRFAGRVPADVVLGCQVPNYRYTYQTIPWRPGSDGRMAIYLPPDCPSLSLEATEYLERTETTNVSQLHAAGAIAVSVDAELILEPLRH